MARRSRSTVPLPETTADDAHPLMTIRAAAEVLGCSDMTIRRRVEARQFPAVKIGCKALVPRVFVERLLADALAGRTVVVEEYAAVWAQTQAASEDNQTPRDAGRGRGHA
jgi:excisionase family DNA binding protein